MNTEQTAPVEETTPETMDRAVELIDRIKRVADTCKCRYATAAWAIMVTELPPAERHLLPYPTLEILPPGHTTTEQS